MSTLLFHIGDGKLEFPSFPNVHYSFIQKKLQRNDNINKKMLLHLKFSLVKVSLYTKTSILFIPHNCSLTHIIIFPTPSKTYCMKQLFRNTQLEEHFSLVDQR